MSNESRLPRNIERAVTMKQVQDFSEDGESDFDKVLDIINSKRR